MGKHTSETISTNIHMHDGRVLFGNGHTRILEFAAGDMSVKPSPVDIMTMCCRHAGACCAQASMCMT